MKTIMQISDNNYKSRREHHLNFNWEVNCLWLWVCLLEPSSICFLCHHQWGLEDFFSLFSLFTCFVFVGLVCIIRASGCYWSVGLLSRLVADASLSPPHTCAHTEHTHTLLRQLHNMIQIRVQTLFSLCPFPSCFFWPSPSFPSSLDELHINWCYPTLSYCIGG